MLLEVMRSINNFFDKTNEVGDYKIEDHSISNVFGKYIKGQYILITGSILNDGVYQIEDIEDGILHFIINEKTYPKWIEPTGSIDAYQMGNRVYHDNSYYESLINANIVVPGTDERYWKLINIHIEHHVLHNEEFTGKLYGLVIPKDFLEIIKDIEEYQGNIKNSDLQSESFSDYSWSKGNSSDGDSSWKKQYAKRLNPHRNMVTEVDI